MDVEFLVQDLYAMTRPHWKLAESLEDASKAFAEAVKTNYNTSDLDKSATADDGEESSASDDGGDDDDLAVVDHDEKSSGEEQEV
jgi:regulator of nonsense transcripts 2